MQESPVAAECDGSVPGFISLVFQMRQGGARAIRSRVLPERDSRNLETVRRELDARGICCTMRRSALQGKAVLNRHRHG